MREPLPINRPTTREQNMLTRNHPVKTTAIVEISMTPPWVTDAGVGHWYGGYHRFYASGLGLLIRPRCADAPLVA